MQGVKNDSEDMSTLSKQTRVLIEFYISSNYSFEPFLEDLWMIYVFFTENLIGSLLLSSHLYLAINVDNGVPGYKTTE